MSAYLGRVFASAIVRRLAYVLVAAVLAYAGMGRAQAADVHTLQSEAWSHCLAVAQQGTCNAVYPTKVSSSCAQVSKQGTNGAFGTYNSRMLCKASNGATATQSPTNGEPYHNWQTNDGKCANGEEWDEASQQCRAACVAGTDSTQTRQGYKPDACRASDACSVTWTQSGAPYGVVGSDGVLRMYQQWAGVVAAGAHCTFVADSDGDGWSDNEDAFPNDPGEHFDGDNDGIGDTGDDPDPTDPTNNEDDGTGDETDNTSVGGGNCETPPESDGDAIAAQIAYQTWATRCEVAKLTAQQQGNNGEGPGGGSNIETNALLDGIDTWLESIAQWIDPSQAPTDDGDPGATGESAWGTEDGDPSFDTSGLGLTRTCPEPPTITLAGMTATIDTSALCDLGSVVAALVYMMTLAHCAWIFADRG